MSNAGLLQCGIRPGHLRSPETVAAAHKPAHSHKSSCRLAAQGGYQPTCTHLRPCVYPNHLRQPGRLLLPPVGQRRQLSDVLVSGAIWLVQLWIVQPAAAAAGHGGCMPRARLAWHVSKHVLANCALELASQPASKAGRQAGEVGQTMTVWRQQPRQAYGPSLWPHPSHKPTHPPARPPPTRH
jgi:hypothetical protein